MRAGRWRPFAAIGACLLALLAREASAQDASSDEAPSVVAGVRFDEPLRLEGDDVAPRRGKPWATVYGNDGTVKPVYYGDPHPYEDREGPAAPAFGENGGGGDPNIDHRENGSDGQKKWPDVSQPGPDMGDFPNSAYTLPRGKAQFEIAPLTLTTRDATSPPVYSAPFMVRLGLTDNVEFRVFGNGIARVDDTSQLSGFAPPKLDMKVHLWDDVKKWLIPACSLEVYVTTTWGTPAFVNAWEPSLNFNFDLPVTEKLNFEWTVGYSGVQQVVNINTGERFVPKFNYVVPGIHRKLDVNYNQFSLQWAVEYQVSEKVNVFFDGFHNGAIHVDLGSGEMIGQGMFYQFNDRLIGFGSVSEGLTPNVPWVLGQLGFAYAL